MQDTQACSRHVRIYVILAAVIACFSVSLILPSLASAKNYKIAPITIDATIGTDGTVDVTDTRTVEFNGSFDYIYWDFPMGDNREGHYEIDGIYEVTESGEEIPYTRTDDAATMKNKAKRVADTYYVATTESKSKGPDTKLYIYFDKSDTTTSFRIKYRAVDMVDAHADVGEMYWQYIAGNHNVVFRDVDVNITMPVPAGTKVLTTGDNANAHAWDQGGIYGSVNTGSDGIVHIHRDKIAMGEYGEARTTFPVTWLTEMTPSTVKHLDTILDEQNTWSKKTSEMTTKSLLKKTGGGITILLIDGIVLVFSLVAFLKWGRQYEPDYHEKYCREIPSRDHPVVLGEVWGWGRIEDRYLTANLMRLSKLGLITLSTEDEDGETRKPKDCIITLHPDVVAAAEDPIDQSLYELLESVGEGETSFALSKIGDWGKAHKDEFNDRIEAWNAGIKDVSKHRGFLESTGSAGKRVLLIIGFILLALSLFVYVPFASGYESVYLWVAAGISVICSLIIIICGFRMKRRSEEAADLQVRLLALERWLKDYPVSEDDGTNDVNEADINDEAAAGAGDEADDETAYDDNDESQTSEEWPELVIVSEVFGILDELVGKLKKTRPDLEESSVLNPVLEWCMGSGGNTPAAYVTASMVELGGIGSMNSGFGGGSQVAGTKGDDDEIASKKKAKGEPKRRRRGNLLGSLLLGVLLSLVLYLLTGGVAASSAGGAAGSLSSVPWVALEAFWP